MDVIIVTHTEFGSVKDYRVSYDLTTGGVIKGVPSLVAVCERHGAKVTFAVMPGVAPYFPEVPGHEIGVHIHAGWEPALIDGVMKFRGDHFLHDHVDLADSTSSLLRDYSYVDQLAMIGAGCDEIEDRLGIRPTSFVAGRWSLNNDTLRALVECGITHECSAVAHDPPSHHDWSRLPRICMPYRPAEDDYQAKGDLPLVEVPIAQMPRFGSVNPESAPRVGPGWLKACFREYYACGLPVFHICLHSPCMTDPYFVEVMDDLLGFIARHPGVHFRTGSEIGDHGGATAEGRFLPYLMGAGPAVVRTAVGAVVRRTA